MPHGRTVRPAIAFGVMSGKRRARFRWFVKRADVTLRSMWRYIDTVDRNMVTFSRLSYITAARRGEGDGGVGRI
jgi:hypothetical protein